MVQIWVLRCGNVGFLIAFFLIRFKTDILSMILNSFFICSFLSSFFFERRKKNAENICLNYTQNVRLTKT